MKSKMTASVAGSAPRSIQPVRLWLPGYTTPSLNRVLSGTLRGRIARKMEAVHALYSALCDVPAGLLTPTISAARSSLWTQYGVQALSRTTRQKPSSSCSPKKKSPRAMRKEP